MEAEEDGGSSSTSTSSEQSSLWDENKRLRSENGLLSSELVSMKRKCQELHDLLAAYAKSDGEEKVERRHKNPLMLFGVRLEVLPCMSEFKIPLNSNCQV